MHVETGPVGESQDEGAVLVADLLNLVDQGDLAALGQLAQLGTDGLTPLIQVTVHPNENVRLTAIDWLASLATLAEAAIAVPALTRALDDDYPLVRAAAACTLGRIKTNTAPAIAALTALAANDPMPFVREEAQWALKQMDSP